MEKDGDCTAQRQTQRLTCISPNRLEYMKRTADIGGSIDYLFVLPGTALYPSFLWQHGFREARISMHFNGSAVDTFLLLS